MYGRHRHRPHGRRHGHGRGRYKSLRSSGPPPLAGEVADLQDFLRDNALGAQAADLGESGPKGDGSDGKYGQRSHAAMMNFMGQLAEKMPPEMQQQLASVLQAFDEQMKAKLTSPRAFSNAEVGALLQKVGTIMGLPEDAKPGDVIKKLKSVAALSGIRPDAETAETNPSAPRDPQQKGEAPPTGAPATADSVDAPPASSSPADINRARQHLDAATPSETKPPGSPNSATGPRSENTMSPTTPGKPGILIRQASSGIPSAPEVGLQNKTATPLPSQQPAPLRL